MNQETMNPGKIMWVTLCVLCVLGGEISAQVGAKIVKVVDVSDPHGAKVQTSTGEVVVCGELVNCLANHKEVKDQLIGETVKTLASDDEIAAQHRMSILRGQKVDLPKSAVDKHNARIAKFAKAKEDALNAAVKKSQVTVKIDNTTSQEQIDAQLKALSEARSLAQKAKSKKDELIAAGIPISDATQKAVEAAQPKPTPTPAATATPTPDGL